jgi:hypothetical protein
MQFTPHEPNTGSPASSAAKTSGVLGAPLFGVLALAAVGLAGGGVGAGLGSLPGIPGLEGTGVKHIGPRLVRGAPTQQIASNAAFTAPARTSGPARPVPNLGLVLSPGTVVGGPITGTGAPPATSTAPAPSTAPLQSTPEPAGPQAEQPRSGTPGVLPPVGTTPTGPNPPTTTTTTTSSPTTTTPTTTTTGDGTPTTTTSGGPPGGSSRGHHNHDGNSNPGYYPGQ